MKPYMFAILGSLIVGLGVTAQPRTAQQAQTTGPRTARPAPGLMPLEGQTGLIKEYCSGCHNEKIRSGGMTLTDLDLAHIDQNPALAEKVIRKVKTGLMPPSTATKRPDPESRKAFVAALET